MVGDVTNSNYFSEFPFQTLTEYDIENNFVSAKRKFVDLMNNDKFQTIVKENKYEELFNPNQNFSCQYYTEDESVIKIAMAMTSSTYFH